MPQAGPAARRQLGASSIIMIPIRRFRPRTSDGYSGLDRETPAFDAFLRVPTGSLRSGRETDSEEPHCHSEGRRDKEGFQWHYAESPCPGNANGLMSAWVIIIKFLSSGARRSRLPRLSTTLHCDWQLRGHGHHGSRLATGTSLRRINASVLPWHRICGIRVSLFCAGV